MDVSNKPLRSAGAELFDAVIKLVAVWGTAAVVGEGMNRLLSELLSRGWRLSISLLAAYLFLLIFFWGGDKRPDLRDAFLAWRYPMVMLLAAYVGYQGHAHRLWTFTGRAAQRGGALGLRKEPIMSEDSFGLPSR